MFLLLLIGLGTANIKAQVRIGGDGAPNAAAVLDLNADESATPAGNKGALALPRVSLASTTAQLNGATPISGMLVYNTNNTLGVGIYFWDGTHWLRLSFNNSANAPLYALVKSLDSTFNLAAIPANGYVLVTAPTVLANDFCPNIWYGTGYQFLTHNGSIEVCDWLHNGEAAKGVHVICYRAVAI